eukprot:TRINITY_DN16114_c0_g1_i1.p1 TRINITY_DN16114_c0_g1~~TRINITY_DN16114_c0_g1_i1.p1  ORF type:complete len:1116 (+),score=215.56 TRINITY_DN16114_c0_g1_i1:104-3451(+)
MMQPLHMLISMSIATIQTLLPGYTDSAGCEGSRCDGFAGAYTCRNGDEPLLMWEDYQMNGHTMSILDVKVYSGYEYPPTKFDRYRKGALGVNIVPSEGNGNGDRVRARTFCWTNGKSINCDSVPINTPKGEVELTFQSACYELNYFGNSTISLSWKGDVTNLVFRPASRIFDDKQWVDVPLKKVSPWDFPLIVSYQESANPLTLSWEETTDSPDFDPLSINTCSSTYRRFVRRCRIISCDDGNVIVSKHSGSNVAIKPVDSFGAALILKNTDQNQIVTAPFKGSAAVWATNIEDGIDFLQAYCSTNLMCEQVSGNNLVTEMIHKVLSAPRCWEMKHNQKGYIIMRIAEAYLVSVSLMVNGEYVLSAWDSSSGPKPATYKQIVPSGTSSMMIESGKKAYYPSAAQLEYLFVSLETIKNTIGLNNTNLTTGSIGNYSHITINCDPSKVVNLRWLGPRGTLLHITSLVDPSKTVLIDRSDLKPRDIPSRVPASLTEVITPFPSGGGIHVYLFELNPEPDAGLTGALDWLTIDPNATHECDVRTDLWGELVLTSEQTWNHCVVISCFGDLFIDWAVTGAAQRPTVNGGYWSDWSAIREPAKVEFPGWTRPGSLINLQWTCRPNEDPPCYDVDVVNVSKISNNWITQRYLCWSITCPVDGRLSVVRFGSSKEPWFITFSIDGQHLTKEESFFEAGRVGKVQMENPVWLTTDKFRTDLILRCEGQQPTCIEIDGTGDEVLRGIHIGCGGISCKWWCVRVSCPSVTSYRVISGNSSELLEQDGRFEYPDSSGSISIVAWCEPSPVPADADVAPTNDIYDCDERGVQQPTSLETEWNISSIVSTGDTPLCLHLTGPASMEFFEIPDGGGWVSFEVITDIGVRVEEVATNGTHQISEKGPVLIKVRSIPTNPFVKVVMKGESTHRVVKSLAAISEYNSDPDDCVRPTGTSGDFGCSDMWCVGYCVIVPCDLSLQWDKYDLGHALLIYSRGGDYVGSGQVLPATATDIEVTHSVFGVGFETHPTSYSGGISGTWKCTSSRSTPIPGSIITVSRSTPLDNTMDDSSDDFLWGKGYLIIPGTLLLLLLIGITFFVRRRKQKEGEAEAVEEGAAMRVIDADDPPPVLD